jgi:hypothetical protein
MWWRRNTDAAATSCAARNPAATRGARMVRGLRRPRAMWLLLGGLILIPPARVDVGATATGLDDHPALQLVAGVHWASLSPTPGTRIDIGAGVVSLSGTGPDDPTDKMDDSLRLTGGYVEVATRPAGNGWWRTWAGVRVEAGEVARADTDGEYVGMAARVTTEAYLSGIDGGGNALIIGTLALGIYGEAAVRQIDGTAVDLALSAGLSIRIPFMFGG